MKKVGVVILNYKLKDEVDRALKSVFESTYKNYEIILVDNGSNDGIEELVEKYPKVHFIQTGQNLGFSEGSNVGINLALSLNCDYILLLNPDAWVRKDTIDTLIQGAEKTDAGILGPKIYFPDGKTILYAGGVFDLKNVLGSHRGVDMIDDGSFDQVMETDYVTGGVMLIRRDVLEKVGLLDVDYFLYYEDADFCFRARKKSFKIVYYPSAVAYHESGKATGIGSPLQDYYITRNRMIFAKKFLSVRTQFALIREGIRNWSKRYRRKAMIDFLLGKLGKQEII